MNDPASGSDLLAGLAEEFAGRYRRGERPALTEYAEKYPELAGRIRDIFPALVVMEQFGSVGGDTVSIAGRAKADVGGLPRQLGDFQILREVARGGMGVVYEAVQGSLGRHVALKVLPNQRFLHEEQLERFRREARAAARLHHTNIVPVFGVGEAEGVHYYAMQFIHGQGLDTVLDELRRLRGTDGPSPADEDRPDEALAPTVVDRPESGRGTGRRADRPSGSADSIGPTPTVGGGADSAGSSDLMGLSGTQYFRGVARIGVQVAEALEYAHRQGVLHRDIKPSNLLLDTRGTTWITDFGLAKADEADGLTTPGDIVGTLRYMAPERFRGESDPRGDVYSLGLTLYELATLRPAFEASGRARLIERVRREEPPRPRKLEPRLPRDLETIILKAIAKEPSRRYPTAAALAEDLRRFLADRPVAARRASAWERTWRWGRRNPGWAAMLATVAGALLVIGVGGGAMSLHLRAALNKAKAADRDKTDKLWQSLMDRARAERGSGRVGQRFAALAALREAARIRVTPELRTEAIAALVLPDAEVAHEWDGLTDETIGVAFDAAFRRYARLDKHGAVTVCRLSDNREEVVARLPAHGKPRFRGVWMSPDGRFMAYGHSGAREGESGGVRVWKLDGPAPAVLLDVPEGMHEYALAFRPDGRQLAIGHADKAVSVYDLATGRRVRRLADSTTAAYLAFHPSDGRLALACHDAGVQLFDVDTGRELPAPRLPPGVSWACSVAWHPDGRRLAAGCNDRKIHHWDAETATEVMPPWTLDNDGIFVAFNHAGDRLVSNDWGGQTRLWDAANGRPLLAMPYVTLQFSPDDRLLGYGLSGRKLRLWRVAAGGELRVLRRRHADSTEPILFPMVHADGRTLAASANYPDPWLSFFDLDSGEELGSVRMPRLDATRPVWFDPSGGWMTGGLRGLFLWPARPDPARPEVLRVGPPKQLTPDSGPNDTTGTGASTNGLVVAVPQRSSTVVFHRDRVDGRVLRRVVLGPQYDVRSSAVSPDGRWVVTCSHWWDGRSKSARLWDAETGRHVRDLPLEGSAAAGFSPDGRWLATYASGFGIRLWEVGTWREARRFDDANFAFSPDGRLLALNDVFGAIRLVEPDTGREAARLTGPEPMWYTPAGFSPDGTRLVATCSGRKALYVWDLRAIGRQLTAMGLANDLPANVSAPEPADRRPSRVEIVAGEAPSALSLEEQARRTIEAGRLAVESRPDDANACNELAWTYVMAPESLRDPARAFALAEKAVRLEPSSANYRNTLGVASYRLGRYREAADTLRANLSGHDGGLLAWDLYFLAMSHHQLGEAALARAYSAWAEHLSRSPGTLSAELLRERDAIRAEAETLMGK